jgi:23S rRNA (uracil1939-C5)-methyltransferase
VSDPLELPHKPQRDERLTVQIDDFDDRGHGTTRLDVLVGPQREPMTLDVHARRTVAGDHVEIQVTNCRRRRVDGYVVDYLERSPMRIAPRCGHFPDQGDRPGCGGCSMQHLSYRHQLAIKERHLKRLLKNAGVDPGLVHPVRATADDGFFYRNKMEFSFAQDNDQLRLGMHPGGYKYEVLEQSECFLMSEFVSDFIGRVRAWARELGLKAYRREEGLLRALVVREGKHTGDRMVDLITSHFDTATTHAGPRPAREVADLFAESLGDLLDAGDITSLYWTRHRAVRGEPSRIDESLLAGEPTLRETLTVAGTELHFEIHPRAFFQTNTVGAEVLYEMVAEDAAPTGTETVLDLYSGTGTIALCIAPAAKHVLGIEKVADAVENARSNAATNGISNVEFQVGEVSAVLADLQPHADVMIVDPPRSGLLPPAHAQLAEIDAERLVYVSCNPTALARDLARLSAAGWTIDRLRPVDMFPQTAHVETVAALRR